MSDEQMGVMLQHIARLEQEMQAMRRDQEERSLYAAPAYADLAMPEAHQPLNEKERLTQHFVQELSNMGLIQPLLEDDTINDVLINGTSSVYIERNGKLIRTDIVFPENSEVMILAERIVKAVGRQLNPARPLVDARLLDGSRVNIIAPPLAVDGTSISIRKFSKRVITLDMMAKNNNVSQQIATFLQIMGKCRMNVIISGGTGSGKTTLLNAVSQFIEDEERVVTIEDAAELKLQQPHIVRLETKPALFVGGRREEEVTIRDLVKNALRMRPDRIIVGEVRGAEAFDMMQAMNTGHDGSLTTIHANHPRDCLSRLENMIGMANLGLPMKSIRSQIASAINIIVQISRMRDGQRRIAYVTEIIGMEGDVITMQDLFSFSVTGEGKDGKLEGDFKWSGIMPRFIRRAAYYGELDRLAQCLNVRVPKL
jgi:pilus assembly protein CpaF